MRENESRSWMLGSIDNSSTPPREFSAEKCGKMSSLQISRMPKLVEDEHSSENQTRSWIQSNHPIESEIGDHGHGEKSLQWDRNVRNISTLPRRKIFRDVSSYIGKVACALGKKN